MPTQAELPGPVDGEADVGSPGQSGRCSRYLFDRDLEVGVGQPPQLLGDERGLQGALGGQVDVLPVAASTTTRSGVGTRWLHPLW
jgi:hypothetical protein